MKKKEYEYDYMFDWVLKKSKLKDVAYQDEESEEEEDNKIKTRLDSIIEEEDEEATEYQRSRS